jgi:hypothetical protein
VTYRLNQEPRQQNGIDETADGPDYAVAGERETADPSPDNHSIVERLLAAIDEAADVEPPNPVLWDRPRHHDAMKAGGQIDIGRPGSRRVDVLGEPIADGDGDGAAGRTDVDPLTT